ncbi:helix-turn-helix transcriptional regulator [Nocardiopsis sp. LOL_012]|uniref:helix-turn-helix transcriptional regulator n=1 Tax=Nocardiopsis sp. LOL_012 TaxID=3345409 RepID=UPI003A8AD94B
MSTMFGHGRLRLYLLKLLDESPRHGYEIISLLRDRFLGVYSPSPGTIYPRLARLEEEGLVAHTEEGGRKVYRLTDKGREELRAREGDLADLEREITDSVRDIARAVKQDVRATISSLREELTYTGSGTRRPEPESADTRQERAEGSGQAPQAEDPSATRTGDQGTGDKERACGDGGPWAREWERFTQGLGGLGTVWGRGQTKSPEFDQALRDFTDRVRDVAHEAGHVGEAAVNDLKRILDETVEVIRRDMGRWGPPGRGGGDEAPTGSGGSPEPQQPREASKTTEQEPETAPSGTAEGPGEPESRPGPEGSADPWGTAVGEQDERRDG